MKIKVFALLVAFMLIASLSWGAINTDTGVNKDPTASGGTIYTSTDCDQAAYYANGVLCQDTDDDKLYKGTGSAVAEVGSAAFSVTDITGQTDDTTPATTATAVLA